MMMIFYYLQKATETKYDYNTYFADCPLLLTGRIRSLELPQ